MISKSQVLLRQLYIFFSNVNKVSSFKINIFEFKKNLSSIKNAYLFPEKLNSKSRHPEPRHLIEYCCLDGL